MAGWLAEWLAVETAPIGLTATKPAYAGWGGGVGLGGEVDAGTQRTSFSQRTMSALAAWCSRWRAM
jgi:hypothetical protein